MTNKVPQYLSAPLQVYWFEADEVSIIALLFVGALLTGGWLPWFLAVIGSYLYVSIKNKNPRGFLKHIFFYIGLKELTDYPGPFEKDFSE